jgi:hypothetical protein
MRVVATIFKERRMRRHPQPSAAPASVLQQEAEHR